MNNLSAAHTQAIQGWQERWHFLPSPAPGVLGMAPVNWTPLRDGTQAGKPARPAMVLWVIAREDGLIWVVNVAGDDAGSWRDALVAEGRTPVLHMGTSDPIMLHTPMGRLPPPDMDRVATMDKALVMAIKVEGQAMMSSFRDILLPEALEAARVSLRREGKHISVSAYNTFMGGAAEGARMPGKAGEWRRQFAERWPLLGAALAGYRELVEACDRGESVPAAASACLRLRAPTLRAFAGAPFGRSGERAIVPKGFGRALRLADALLPSMLPGDPAQWHACMNLASTLSAQMDTLDCFKFLNETLDKRKFWKGDVRGASSETAAWLQDIVRRGPPRWGCSDVENAMVETDDDGPSRAERGAGHSYDACAAFAQEVLVPLIVDATNKCIEHPNTTMQYIQQRAYVVAIGTLGLMSRRSVHSFQMVCWRHLAWTQLPILLQAEPGDGFEAPAGFRLPPGVKEWMPLADDATTPDGWRITNLTNQVVLKREGIEMDHCVGSYDWLCLEGACSILGLAGPGGERSTAEIRLPPPGKKKSETDIVKQPRARLRVYQHKGMSNLVLPPGATNALNWYVKAMADGRVDVNEERMALMEASYSLVNSYQNMFAAARAAQMQATMDPEARRLAWDRWRRWMGVEHETPGEWMAGLPRELATMHPAPPYDVCKG